MLWTWHPRIKHEQEKFFQKCDSVLSLGGCCCCFFLFCKTHWLVLFPGKEVDIQLFDLWKKRKNLHRRLFQANSRILLVAGVSLFLTATVGVSYSLTYRWSHMINATESLPHTGSWGELDIRHDHPHQSMKSSLRNDPSPSRNTSPSCPVVLQTVACTVLIEKGIILLCGTLGP